MVEHALLHNHACIQKMHGLTAITDHGVLAAASSAPFCAHWKFLCGHACAAASRAYRASLICGFCAL
jgi:hypothetical protein